MEVAYRSVARQLSFMAARSGRHGATTSVASRARERIAVVTQVLGHADAAVVQNALTAIPAFRRRHLRRPTSPTFPLCPPRRLRAACSPRTHRGDATALTDAGGTPRGIGDLAGSSGAGDSGAQTEAELLLAEGLSNNNAATKGALDSYTPRAFVATGRAAKYAAVRAASRVDHVITTWLRKPDEADDGVLMTGHRRPSQARRFVERRDSALASCRNMPGARRTFAISDELVRSAPVYGDRDMRVGRALGPRAIVPE
jgi:hypothetical protein